MESNAKKVIDGDVKSLNLTKLWRIIDDSTMLQHGLSEYLKLAEVAIVLVLGSVEDEYTFSTLSFMKDKLRNRL
jgi:2-C-methyl-D-erythritol 4-phosphate cytidylyltransferase